METGWFCFMRRLIYIYKYFIHKENNQIVWSEIYQKHKEIRKHLFHPKMTLDCIFPWRWDCVQKLRMKLQVILPLGYVTNALKCSYWLIRVRIHFKCVLASAISYPVLLMQLCVSLFSDIIRLTIRNAAQKCIYAYRKLLI